MKTKILFNSSDKDINDYRVEEAELNADGEIIIDSTTGRPRWSGNTREWSIKAGERVEFPAYVADYLQNNINFLEEVKAEEIVGSEEKPVEAKPKEAGKIVCRYCGQTFRSAVNLGVHLGSKHSKEIV